MTGFHSAQYETNNAGRNDTLCGSLGQSSDPPRNFVTSVSSVTPMVVDGDDDITGINVVFVSMLPETDQTTLPALPPISTNTVAKALIKNIEFCFPLHNVLAILYK